MKDIHLGRICAAGMAMFAMFFGAGNVVFPLAIGQYAQDQVHWAVLGLLLTAVSVPFIGLIGMCLYDGNYRAFFNRVGRVPGFIIATLIMALIGPFGAIPRCITLSYSTLHQFWPHISVIPFSLFACFIIFLFTRKENNILEVIGYVLTPLKLGLLGWIIAKGISDADSLLPSNHSAGETFLHGLNQGYQTMDLFGAFFFSSVVLHGLKRMLTKDENRVPSSQEVFSAAVKASCIGAALLGMAYIGFCYAAAYQSGSLVGISQDRLISAISLHVLGSGAGIVACLTVAVACLTTAIALTNVFAEFITHDLTQGKCSYYTSLLITLALSFAVSTLEFQGIVAAVGPLMEVGYPALLVFSLLNILHKLTGLSIIKTPVALTFIVACWIKWM